MAGIDLITRIIEIAKSKQKTIFFLGTKQEIVKALAEKVEALHGQEIIAGYRNGYFDHNNSKEVAKKIAKKNRNLISWYNLSISRKIPY